MDMMHQIRNLLGVLAEWNPRVLVLHRFMVASSRGLSIMTTVRALRYILCFGSWSVAPGVES